MSAIGPGSVNTTWKYATGSRSASRAASQSFAAAPWHFGQCRLRQELYEIWVCAHFSQRATCPPSAAVRQLSIADITFNWPRLTWPALARRHAGPWPRKMSATSSDGRDTRSLASGGRLDPLDLTGDMLQRAHDFPNRLGGDACIERRGIEPGVPEQDLDHSDIDVLLEQVGGEAVPQGVERYALVDLRPVGCGMTGAIELTRRHRLNAVAPWKQPALRSCRPPPGAQQFEQMWRQHHVAVFAAFALLDANDHAFAVDVADLEPDHLGSAQTRAMSHAQRGLVFEPWCCIQQARHFLRTEHDRQLAGLMNESRVLDDVGARERNPDKEPQRSHGVIENRDLRAARRQMQLKASDVLEARRIGRSAEGRGLISDGADVALLGLWR